MRDIGVAPGHPPDKAGADTPAERGFGLPQAIALIMGSIIGVGVFNLPSPPGPVRSDHPRLAGIDDFINKSHTTWISMVLVLIGLWVPAAVNLSGVKNMGSIQVVTTVLKFAALVFMSTVGLFYIHTANYTPWNLSGSSAVSAIGSGMAIALFSYIGVETASIAAGKVRDPDRNVPRATTLGTLATAVVYMLSLIAIFGILPNSKLLSSTAPFSDAANVMFGGTSAGNVMAILVIISGLGALNGWTMICAEMPLAAARDGLFPERFVRDVTVAVVSLIFSILFIVYSRNTGHTGFQYWAPFILAGVALVAGVPIYRRQRGHMSEPEPVPAYR
jgi:amino acid transporter